MKYFLLIVFLSSCCNALTAERIQKAIKGLDSPVTFDKTQVTRASPTLYFDQAIESIPAMNKGAKFHCQERLVELGDVSFSLYCFPSPGNRLVTIGGELVKENSSWVYTTEVEPDHLNGQLIRLIESLNNFANGRLQ